MREQAEALGMVMVVSPLLYKGEPYEDKVGTILCEEDIHTATPNAEQYKEVFAKYKGNELIYVSKSQKAKYLPVFDQLKSAGIQGLTILDSGFYGEAQVEVTKRIIAGKPYDDVKYFFVMRNSLTGFVKTVQDKFCLFTMENGEFKLLNTFSTRFAAIALLKKLVNSELHYRKDLNSTMGRHYGKDYIGGISTGK
jgi:hypothetical protein